MTDIFEQMREFHRHFGFDERLKNMKEKELEALLDFRLGMMQEEIFEVEQAIDAGNAEEVVDGIIDLIVFAAGTLDMFNVDGKKAWDEVMRANMEKKVGTKEGRENAYGFPDLVKPEGWAPPTHENNTGILEEVLDDD